MWRPAAILALLIGVAIGAPAAAPGAGTKVDLELVLAVDSSASVDREEFALQFEGIARAFRDPEVIQAIADGPYGAIAVTVMEWSSLDRQAINIPWHRIDGDASAARFADLATNAPRLIDTGATSISAAITTATTLFESSGLDGCRPGNGNNIQGFPMSLARRAAEDAGVTVDGLAIENQVQGLSAYYRHNVITGFAAFAIEAADYKDYIQAFRRKLLREIRNVPVS